MKAYIEYLDKYFIKTLIIQEILTFALGGSIISYFAFNYFTYARKNVLLFIILVFTAIVLTFIEELIVKSFILHPIKKILKGEIKEEDRIKKHINTLSYISSVEAINIFVRWAIILGFIMPIPMLLLKYSTFVEFVLSFVIIIFTGIAYMPIYFFISEKYLIEIYQIPMIYDYIAGKERKKFSIFYKILFSIISIVLYPISIFTMLLYMSVNNYIFLNNYIGVILIIIQTIILGTLTTFLLSGYIKNNINSMSDQIKQILKGEFVKNISYGGDEISELGDISNKLSNYLGDFLAKLIQYSRSLKDISSKINDYSIVFNSESTEQASTVTEIVTTVQDNEKVNENLKTSLKDILVLSERSKDSAVNGKNILDKNIEKYELIKQNNDNVILSIKRLNDNILKIWDIINIINTIADQTKIIAFNAELEASSAAEYGKNFEIVATEIRRLANNTVQSTKEIKNTINLVQSSLNELIKNSEQATEEIKSGYELTNNTKEKLLEVSRNSEEANNEFKSITNQISIQIDSFHQILISLKQISNSIRNFADSSVNLKNFSENLKHISNGIDDIILKLKD